MCIIMCNIELINKMFILTWIYIQVCACVLSCIHVSNMLTYVSVFKHICIHALVWLYTYMHTRAYTYIYVCVC